MYRRARDAFDVFRQTLYDGTIKFSMELYNLHFCPRSLRIVN